MCTPGKDGVRWIENTEVGLRRLKNVAKKSNLKRRKEASDCERGAVVHVDHV